MEKESQGIDQQCVSEVESAKSVIKWLDAQQWDVYQEVQVWSGGNRADIVATLGNLIWVIEVKQSLSLSLLDQASRWLAWAHFVSVAVKSSRHRRTRAALEYLKWKGIGFLTVRDRVVYERLSPALHRKAMTHYVEDSLTDQHKTFAAAGNSSNKYWTPYQETCQRILRLAMKSPGITMKEMLETLKHHYASDQSARCAISKWAWLGKIKGVEIKREGRLLRFYPTNIP